MFFAASLIEFLERSLNLEAESLIKANCLWIITFNDELNSFDTFRTELIDLFGDDLLRESLSLESRIESKRAYI